MKILWHENPFKTKIEIDDRDKKHILTALQKDHYEMILCEIEMKIDGKLRVDSYTVNDIKKDIEAWGEICNLDINSEELLDIYDDLNYSHIGDCVCLPAACMRCHAENLLGVDILKGLGKHSAYKVRNAFKNETTTIDEAIATLEKGIPDKTKPESWENFSQEAYEKHLPRWNSEYESAAKWLKEYKEMHGFGETK